jgi:hypothetical protein
MPVAMPYAACRPYVPPGCHTCRHAADSCQLRLCAPTQPSPQHLQPVLGYTRHLIAVHRHCPCTVLASWPPHLQPAQLQDSGALLAALQTHRLLITHHHPAQPLPPKACHHPHQQAVPRASSCRLPPGSDPDLGEHTIPTVAEAVASAAAAAAALQGGRLPSA